MLTIEVGNARSYLVGDVDPEVIQEIDRELSYELPGAFFARRYHPMAGVKRLFRPASRSFPTGLLRRVRKVLKREQVGCRIVDKRTPVELGKPKKVHGIKFRDYQEHAIEESIKKQRGIVKVGTGGGKTNIFIGVVARLNIPTIILIHKTDVYYQIIERLEEALKIPIGRIGDQVCDIKPITVAMIQSVAAACKGKSKKKKHKERKKEVQEYIQSVQCIITDECHHTPADSFLDVHEKADNAYYKIGMSASPWRDDKNDMLIEAWQGDVIVDVPSSELIKRGFLVKPMINLLQFNHKPKSRDKVKYSELYDEEVVYNDARNYLILESALEAIKANKSVLIAVTKIEHGQILEKLIQEHYKDAIFVHGEANSDTRKLVLDELNNKKRMIVICTTIFGEGVDVPNLDVLINAKAGASSVDSFQLVGRVLRKPPGKERAYVVDIFDTRCKYLGAHSKAREVIYNTEKEYVMRSINSTDDLIFDDSQW